MGFFLFEDPLDLPLEASGLAVEVAFLVSGLSFDLLFDFEAAVAVAAGVEVFDLDFDLDLLLPSFLPFFLEEADEDLFLASSLFFLLSVFFLAAGSDFSSFLG